MSDKNTLSADSVGPLGKNSQAPPALEVFLDKHPAKVIALAVLLALGVVGYVIFDGIQKSSQESAGALFSKAEDISELQEVVKNHEGTTAADSAKVLLAEKQWQDGQKDDAIATLQAFVEGDASHPARPSALASLASKLAMQGKSEKAEELFRKITDDSGARYLAPYAWVSLGDIALAKGDKVAAAKAYETVEREFPENPFAKEAIQRRLLLKAASPVEVAAPIVLPGAKLSGEDGGAAHDGVKSGDLLDALRGGGRAPASNPLLPAAKIPEE